MAFMAMRRWPLADLQPDTSISRHQKAPANMPGLVFLTTRYASELTVTPQHLPALTANLITLRRKRCAAPYEAAHARVGDTVTALYCGRLAGCEFFDVDIARASRSHR